MPSNTHWIMCFLDFCSLPGIMIPKVFLTQDYISTHSIMFRLDSGKLISMPLLLF